MYPFPLLMDLMNVAAKSCNMTKKGDIIACRSINAGSTDGEEAFCRYVCVICIFYAVAYN